MHSKAKDKLDVEEKTVMVTHCSHCGGTCLLKLHVKGGIITRIETDDGEEPQYRACSRGRAMRQRVYAPGRILHPLKRVGARGEGKFEQISWDEALDTVASELIRIRDTYGPASILFKRSGGDLGFLHNRNPHMRLLSMAGGCSAAWGVHSFEGGIFAQVSTFGTVATSNTRDDLLNSKLIIMWGWNPADTWLQTNTAWFLTQAREAGIKIISIDPRYTNTAALCADQWIPIRPGTDAAMLIAMAYVMIDENLHDQKFLDTYTVGFEMYRDYVMGVEDGIAKTPQWAESITGVPAVTILNLAREYATTKPAALMAGIGPGRTAFGEQYHRAATTLAAMTGNVGIHGGDAGVTAWIIGAQIYPQTALAPGMSVPLNPVDAVTPPRKNAFSDWGGFGRLRNGHMNQTKVADAILKGKTGGYPSDYKFIYIMNNSYPNQYQNVNKCVEALKSENMEFIVVLEQFMTPGAKLADIILPVNTCFERDDITNLPTAECFIGFMGKAVDSVGDSKSHTEICTALAEKLGLTDYNDKTDDEWIKQMADGSPYITDYDAFKKAGGVKIKLDEPHVAFKEQIEDPENNPFPTPSGKMEIYCQRIADMNDPLLPPIPKYIETWESTNDPLAQKYPLQLITTHLWRRAHSQYDNLPWLKEIETQSVMMNSADAEVRDIKNGDMVRAFNDRGVTMLPAKVTVRIAPGVVDIPQGAWYDPDENGIDRAGCANILTKDEHSPGGAFVTNTTLVQIEKA